MFPNGVFYLGNRLNTVVLIMKLFFCSMGLVASLVSFEVLFAERPQCEGAASDFPPELVEFGPASEQPLMAGTDSQHWDQSVRERGWVMREDG
jgi:hypothetical protein